MSAVQALNHPWIVKHSGEGVTVALMEEEFQDTVSVEAAAPRCSQQRRFGQVRIVSLSMFRT